MTNFHTIEGGLNVRLDYDAEERRWTCMLAEYNEEAEDEVIGDGPTEDDAIMAFLDGREEREMAGDQLVLYRTISVDGDRLIAAFAVIGGEGGIQLSYGYDEWPSHSILRVL